MICQRIRLPGLLFIAAVTAAATSADGDYNGIDPGNVSVTNEDDDYLVGGFVTGDVGSGLVLQNNGGDDLAISMRIFTRKGCERIVRAAATRTSCSRHCVSS